MKTVFHLYGHIISLSLVSARACDFLLLTPPISGDNGLDTQSPCLPLDNPS